MSDDFTLDFSDVKAAGGFDPIPAGWYVCAINGYEDREVRNAGKLPAGTPGTNWEFEVIEGEYEGRRIWTNTWHVSQSLPFMKSLFAASGAFTEEELNGPLSLDDRDRLEGQELLVRVKVRPARGQYEASNDVSSYDHIDNKEKRIKAGGNRTSSLMP